VSWRIRFSVTTTLVVVALLATGYGLAANPLLAAGAVLGVIVLAVTLTWPMVVVAVMLALGPVNLGFLTGGYKELLPALGGLDMSGIRLVGISAGLATVVLTRADLLKALVAIPARWYVLFLAWAGATLAFSPASLEGLRLLLKLAYPLLIFLVVAAPERRVGELHRLGDWALWGATLLLLINPIFVVNGSYVLESNEWFRVSLPGSHQNPLSFYLLAIVMICIGRFRARGQARYLLLGSVATVWIALTLTRITFLASFVAMAIVTLHTAIADRNWRVLLAAAVFAVILGGLALEGVLVRTFGYLPNPGQLLALMLDPVTLYQAINWQGRDTLWGILILSFQASPVVGSGLGASSMAIEAVLGETMVAHNEYLRLAVDTGLIGCLLFFLAMRSWIGASMQAMRRVGRKADEYAMPALALIAAYGVIALTDNALDYYGPLTQYVGFLAAACVVLGRETEVSTAHSTAPDPGHKAVFNDPLPAGPRR
jgi:O-antigen ligase